MAKSQFLYFANNDEKLGLMDLLGVIPLHQMETII
jgi:hypothetical protein